MDTLIGKPVLLILFLSLSSGIKGQIDGERYLEHTGDSVGLTPLDKVNYRRVVTPLAASSGDGGVVSPFGIKSLTDIEFFDGFGRSSYLLACNRSTSQKHLLTYTETDYLGRKFREWLPVSYSGDGSDVTVARVRSEAVNLYSDDRPYLETKYESSPIDRMLRQTGPGTSWKDHPGSCEYYVNSSAGEFSCKHYELSGDNLVCRGVCLSGELSVVKRTNEDGHVTCHYFNRLGQVVLDRKYLDGESFDTYYVYDDYNDLRYVLPPEACDLLTSPGVSWNTNTSVALRDYGFYYRYDDAGRCVLKKLPGCDPVYLVYDSSDRLVLQQDGNQRLKNLWTVYKYDRFGRLAYTSQVQDSTPFETQLSTFRDLLVTESFTTGSQAHPMEDTGYSRGFYHLAPTELLTVNYYDNYDFLSLLPSAISRELTYRSQTGYGTQYSDSKGLLTGSRTYYPGDASLYTTTVYYYDYRGNLVQQRSTNHLSGYDHHYYALNFSGKVSKHLHQHVVSTGTILPESYSYSYDYANRLSGVTYRLFDRVTYNLLSNSYDELGRLSKQKINNSRETTVAYDYNLRGWPTLISSRGFRQRLYYEDFGKYFTGNLSQMEWSVKGEEFTRSYLFEYDGLDRLRQSVYGELTSSSGQVNHKFDVEISGYDKHGNLLGLKRRGLISLPLFRPDGGTFPSTGSPGSFGVIDDLRFEYRGNRVTSVSDSSPNDPSYKDVMHFVDGSDASAEYVYDGNGNMVSDGNKQVELIEYDVHNLPRFIRQSKIYTSGFYPSGRPRSFRRELVDYVYDASGRKLQVRYTTERGQSVPGSSSSPPVENVTWELNTKRDYCDNFIYENDTLSMILTSAGFVSVSGNTLTPYYYLRDHQGNVRVVTDSQGSVLQVNHYYPFGGLFGDSGGGSVQPFKYGGKELDRMLGLDLYDFVSRFQDPMLGRFMSVDPLCEKYYSVSPYAYCLNNPVKYVDPDGRDVYIHGPLRDKAFSQLQSGSRGLKLNLDESGLLCYSLTNKKLNDYARRMINMIDDSSITLNINATDNNNLPNGSYFVGGAFMGNSVSTGTDGSSSVTASQTVNPDVLGAADDFTYSSGKMMMHELSEAYEGSLLSKEKGVSSPRSGVPGSVYEEAHKRATPQVPVYERMRDEFNKETKYIEKAIMREFYVKNYLNNEKIIQIQKIIWK